MTQATAEARRDDPPVRALNPLTRLADAYGSDKGSSKHRYTELYHMLLSPYRTRKMVLMELGLMIGGPEHGASKDREVAEPPSVRMWLDYLPKAQVIGVDVSDFAAYQTDRFRFFRCDLDDPDEIARTATAITDEGLRPDVIIDDASHASHHQQAAFLQLFPMLKPGGLYFIEDLRWQPKTYERDRTTFTRTADLFQSYLQRAEFRHKDSDLAQQFDALRPMISGCFMHQVRYDKRRKDQILVVHKA